eukprot:TRINITY_DN10948_c0_g1_i1.p1 TRINITY_DN10948_c0_g1~~TRINITY_DN10948_c0_g1_i1.p1  ORF type:complete len:399 (-),score=59.29 TRINITY_DN10948_c0_g1_i1:13-1209(-)
MIPWRCCRGKVAIDVTSHHPLVGVRLEIRSTTPGSKKARAVCYKFEAYGHIEAPVLASTSAATKGMTMKPKPKTEPKSAAAKGDSKKTDTMSKAAAKPEPKAKPKAEQRSSGTVGTAATSALSSSNLDDEIELPSYWDKVTAKALGFGDRIHLGSALTAEAQKSQASESTIKACQQLMEQTWKFTTTRDRGYSEVSKFQVVQVLRNENPALWARYYIRRKEILAECRAKSKAIQRHSAKTLNSPSSESMIGNAKLLDEVNEFYLFHGTKPSAANVICTSDFKVDLAGSNKGSLYGKGIYFAEASSKADEYAHDDTEGLYMGLYAMLLSRVTCGDCLYNDEIKPNCDSLRNDMAKYGCHSVLGDREKARNTYREFVVFDANQAYPEYVVIYRRTQEATF